MELYCFIVIAMTSWNGGGGTLYYYCLVRTAFNFFLSLTIDFIPPPPPPHNILIRWDFLMGQHDCWVTTAPKFDLCHNSIKDCPPARQALLPRCPSVTIELAVICWHWPQCSCEALPAIMAMRMLRQKKEKRRNDKLNEIFDVSLWLYPGPGLMVIG